MRMIWYIYTILLMEGSYTSDDVHVRFAQTYTDWIGILFLWLEGTALWILKNAYYDLRHILNNVHSYTFNRSKPD